MIANNYKAEKFNAICKKNFYLHGNSNSFDYVPEYLKEYITEMTYIIQKPVFVFPNGFEFHLELKTIDGKQSWLVTPKLGDFKFDSFLDYEFKKINTSLNAFKDLLGAFYFIPSEITTEWINTLQNPRRRSWKTSEDILTSSKFLKFFNIAIQKAIEENKKYEQMLEPGFEEYIKSRRDTETNYSITYNFGVTVNSNRWNSGYTVQVSEDKKTSTYNFDFIEEVNSFIAKFIKK